MQEDLFFIFGCLAATCEAKLEKRLLFPFFTMLLTITWEAGGYHAVAGAAAINLPTEAKVLRH